MLDEERAVLRLLYREGKFVPFWPFLKELVGGGPERDKRPIRDMWMKLIYRLIAEKKIVRYRKRNLIGLAPELR